MLDFWTPGSRCTAFDTTCEAVPGDEIPTKYWASNRCVWVVGRYDDELGKWLQSSGIPGNHVELGTHGSGTQNNVFSSKTYLIPITYLRPSHNEFGEVAP